MLLKIVLKVFFFLCSFFKYVVFGFIEVLNEELRILGKDGIYIIIVCLMFVDMGFVK